MKEVVINKENLSLFLEDIRKEDKEELEFFLGTDFKEKFLELSLDSENSYFLFDDNDNPVAIGGFSPVSNPKIAQVWLLCTNKAIEHRIELYKFIKGKIELYKEKFEIMYNFIFKSNFDALLWLKRCGFSSVEFGNPNYKLFYLNLGENNFDIRNFTCK